jgi:3-isopropylmalate/(R)-2-methylmalate dehydratase small subunit
MKPFRTLHSLAAPLDRVNVDTDQIIPKQFLKRVERTGYGEFLFYDWRYTTDNATGQRTLDPNFELNKPQYAGAEILVANKNFGCGSSREHAAWSLEDYGFRCVLAPSFADIFFSNAGKNGILLITLPDDQIATLLDRARQPGYTLTVSLETETVHDDHGFSATFTTDPFRRNCLLEGLDHIGLSLKHAAAIEKFEQQHNRSAAFAARPSAVTPAGAA